MLTANQLQKRKNYLGASEVAAVLGFNPWHNAYDVWITKVRELDYKDNPPDVIKRGYFLEDGLIAWACDRLGIKKCVRNQFRVSSNGVMSATLDALICGKKEAIEIKTTGQWQEWGQEDTDEIPVYNMIQVQCQMFAANLDMVHLFALMPGFKSLDFKYYPIKRNDEMIKLVVEKAMEWWTAHVKRGIEPEITEPPDLKLLGRIKREPDSYGEMSMKTVRAYELAKLAYDKAKLKKDAKKSILIAELGINEAARLKDGRTVTYMFHGKKTYRDLYIK